MAKIMSAPITPYDHKLTYTDRVSGELTEHQKDVQEYHMYHAVPYYFTSRKEDPYGYRKGKK